MIKNPEFEWRKAAHWNHQSYAEFQSMPVRDQCTVIAMMRIENNLSAMMAKESADKAKAPKK